MIGGKDIKNFLAFVITVIVSISIASFGFAAGLDKCEKCHKGDKTPDKMIAKAKIGTASELMKALREGPKSGMHKSLTDNEVNGAAKALELK